MLAFNWTPSWGTLPDWLAAFGTVGAFVAGLRLLRKELDTRREAVEDRRRAQARLVSAWVSPARVRTGLEPEEVDFGHTLTARNGSDEPVHNVMVKLYRMRQPQENAGAFYFDVLPPQSTEERSFVRDPGGLPWLLVSWFTDAQGYSWERLPNGSLRIRKGPPATHRRSVKDRLDAFAKGQIESLDT